MTRQKNQKKNKSNNNNSNKIITTSTSTSENVGIPKENLEKDKGNTNTNTTSNVQEEKSNSTEIQVPLDSNPDSDSNSNSKPSEKGEGKPETDRNTCEIKAKAHDIDDNNCVVNPVKCDEVKICFRNSKISSKNVTTAAPVARVVYVASVCHVCKQAEDSTKGIQLSLCGGCKMVRYCSQLHQKQDWKSHKPLCTQLQTVLKQEKKSYLYEGTTNTIQNPNQWLQIRYEYMLQLRDRLGRELEPYEKEIFLFPQYFCLECGQTKLNICKICHHHHHHHQQQLSSSSPSKNGKNWCEEYCIWMNMLTWETENGRLIPQCDEHQVTIPIFNNHLTNDIFPQNMQQFFNLQNLDQDIPKSVWRGVITDIITVPLTIIWSIINHAPQLQQLQTLTIHMIGAEMDFEGICPKKWETCFLHLLQNTLQNLNIVLIGPELFPQPHFISLCSECKEKGRRLTITNRPNIFYHKYVKQTDFVRPNIICAMNAGIYRKTGYNGEDTWLPTISILGNTDLLVCTAYTETEIEQDTQRILSGCQGLQLSGQFQENPYRSLKPQRTLINEDCEPLMYKNQYIAVFKGK